jgi:hypothetical protein
LPPSFPMPHRQQLRLMRNFSYMVENTEREQSAAKLERSIMHEPFCSTGCIYLFSSL